MSRYIPTMPKASNDELGLDVSGTRSLDIFEMDASPYLIFAGDSGLWSFFEDRGWRTRPSTAAQTRTLRAKLGMFQFRARKIEHNIG